MTQLDATADACPVPALPGIDDAPETAVATAVAAELATFLTAKRAEAAAVDPRFADATDALAAFVLGGGKRVRPVFAWWGWRGAGGTPNDPSAPDVLRAVSSLELIQACALVHDDLMDASDTRRGAPTVHVDFAGRHRDAGWLGAPQRFGDATAILLGDVALAWADDMLRGSGLDPQTLARAYEPWQAMRTELLGGQYLDVLTQVLGDESTAAALRVSRYKTAAYTVERPLHLGAALAGAPADLIDAYRRFGADIGIAFQLRDDLQGLYGDPTVTGKPAGDDLREGKRTLLLAHGLAEVDARGDTAAGTLLRGAIGDQATTEQTASQVASLLAELGAVDRVETMITELHDSALAVLDAADVTDPARDRLAALAAAATKRVR